MASTKIMNTPQYQIYLEALEALKEGGYELDGNKINSKRVLRGSESYGIIFVVDYPKEFGCFSILIPNRILELNEYHSDYEGYQRTIANVHNSRKRGKSYWPDGSLVGGFTTDDYGHTYNDKWLNILDSVVSKYIED